MKTDSPNIVLIGMPGSGKSTLGRALARRLGREFVDTDEDIVRRTGVDIATIFDIEGEAGFRRREVQAIAELSERTGIVLATGGGAILADANRRALKAGGIVLYLRADLDELVRRTGRDDKRPLLQAVDAQTRLAELLAAREPLYNALADIVLDVGMGAKRHVLERALRALDATAVRSTDHP